MAANDVHQSLNESIAIILHGLAVHTDLSLRFLSICFHLIKLVANHWNRCVQGEGNDARWKASESDDMRPGRDGTKADLKTTQKSGGCW
jgi:hypothetical protein